MPPSGLINKGALMPDIYRPLFSRRTLKVLLWILPALILLLASLGPAESDLPEIRRLDERPVYWLEQPDSTDNELRLLFATDIAVTPEQRIAQQALAAGLRSRLEQSVPGVGVEALADRLQLRLRWPAGGGAPDLSTLFASLKTPPETTALEAKLKRLRARDYLDAQSPDQLLLNSYRAHLPRAAVPKTSVSDLQLRHQTLLAQVPLVLIGGPDASAAAREAARALPAGETRSPPQLLPPDSRLRLTLDDARQPPMQLLGGAVPVPTLEDYAAELLAFGSLQQALERQPGLRYRLFWQPLGEIGLHALILPGAIEDPRTLLRDSSLALIDDIRRNLLRQQREQLNTPQGQLDRLADIAFYRLPDNRLDALAEALAAVGKDDIATRMSHYLEPDSQIRIELNAGPL